MRRPLKDVLTEYGTTALVIYLIIFGAFLVGFWLAIRTGWQPRSATGSVGTLAAAYVATKVTQPVRIAATIVLTPLVARAYDRIRSRRFARGAHPPDSPDMTA